MFTLPNTVFRHRAYPATAAALLTIVLSGCNNAERPNTQAAIEDTPPLHEQVVNYLRSSDSAVPPTPDVYPVRTVYNREAM